MGNWKLKTPVIPYTEEDTVLEKLAKIHGISDIKKFLNPPKSSVHKPSLLLNADKAVARIVKAIENSENITVTGDPDFDGVSSLSIMVKLLHKFTNKVSYICNERSEGHNIYKLVRNGLPQGTELVISLDSSSNDTKTAELLEQNGIDWVIIDHHQIENENPLAIIVNPQQEKCSYPNKNACGGLLTFKICQLLDQHYGTEYSAHLETLAGFSLSADMMSMMEMENRYYFKKALKEVNHLGLRMLFEKMGKKINKLRASDFQYQVSPALTAATRADNISLAIDFMLCEDQKIMSHIIETLIDLNEKRKLIQAQAVEELKSTVNPEDLAIVLENSQIGKGYNGLVAQEIMKIFNRPTIILGESEEEGLLAGSLRSPEDLAFLSIVKTCPSINSCGGHEGAAGLSVHKKNLTTLKKELEDKLSDYNFDDSKYYDLSFDIKEINEDTIRQIEKFYQVSGHKFKEGNFKVTGVFVETEPAILGKLKNTIKITCGSVALMKFKTDIAYAENFPVWTDLEVLGTLTVNEWEFFNREKRRKEISKTCQILIDEYQKI